MAVAVLLCKRMLKMGRVLSSLLKRVLVLSCKRAGSLPPSSWRQNVSWLDTQIVILFETSFFIIHYLELLRSNNFLLGQRDHIIKQSKTKLTVISERWNKQQPMSYHIELNICQGEEPISFQLKAELQHSDTADANLPAHVRSFM